MYQLMKTTKQKAKQIKTQKPHKKDKKTIIQTLAVLGKQDTGLRKLWRKLKEQSWMHNPETLTILDTQDTGRTQRKKKKKIQPRTPPNIRHPLCYWYSQNVLEPNICKQTQ